MTDKATKQVIVDMLTENTGRHFLDSGGAYGRHWQRNKSKPTIEHWENTPSARLEVWKADAYYPIISLYHFLTNHHGFDLEYRPDMQAKLDQIANDNPDQYYNDDIKMFLDQLSEQYDISDISSGYTYNSENNLSQNFIYHCFENEDTSESFVILQIHGGCDARGGFTAPKIFELQGYDARCYFLNWNQCYIADQSGNCWDYDGHYYNVGRVEGIDLIPNQLKLIEVPASYDKVGELQHYDLELTEDNKLLSPIDGTVLEAYLL